MDLDPATVAALGSGVTVASVTGMATFFIRQYAGLIEPWRVMAKAEGERADRAEKRADLWTDRALECEEETRKRGRLYKPD